MKIVCLSVSKKQFGSHSTNFRDILYWGLLAKFTDKLKVVCNRTKNHEL